MKTTFIYAHLMPREDEIFYIGKADDPYVRLSKHLSDAKTEKHYQANKLRKLAARGFAPRVEIIAEVLVEDWEFWECHYIKYFRDLGFRLTNATDGGDGCVGRRGPTGRQKNPGCRAGGWKRSLAWVEKIRRVARSDNASGAVGVSWDKKNAAWRASIQINGRSVNLGRFKVLEDAILAREAALTQPPELRTV